MATTADLYAHVMPAAHRDAADLLDRTMTSATKHAWLEVKNAKS